MTKPMATAVLCLSLLSASCAANIALTPVRYAASSAVRSDTRLLVNVTTVEGSANDVRAIPIFVSATPREGIRFNRADQRTFSKSLEGELLRIGMFSQPSGSESQGATRVGIVFSTTNYLHRPFFEYRLGFRVEASSPGKASFSKDYVVNSSDGFTVAQNWGLNVSEAKQRVAELALAKVISDLELYISQEP